MIATRSHTTVALEETKNGTVSIPRQPPTCSLHDGEESKLYCQDCSTAICRDCAITVHRHHDYEFLKDIATAVSSRLPELLKSLKESQEKMKSHLEVMEGQLSIDECKATINKACDSILSMVESCRKSLLDDLAVRTTEAKKGIDDTKKALAEVSSAVEFIAGVDTDSDYELVTLMKPKLQSFQDLAHDPVDLTPVTPLAITSGDMNQLKAQLPKITSFHSRDLYFHMCTRTIAQGTNNLGKFSPVYHYSYHSCESDPELRIDSDSMPCKSHWAKSLGGLL